MSDISWPFRILIYLVILVLVSGYFVIFTPDRDTSAPLRIGVLMDLSGPMDLDPEQVLDWAAETVNAAGGINGREIELVYRDTADTDVLDAAAEFFENDEYQIVIGPQSSDDAFVLAPKFIQRKKLLISPTATSSDLYRAFSAEKYFWRTIPGDMNQAKTILSIMDEREVTRLALVYQDSPYGKTFIDWLSFLAYDTELKIVGSVCLDQESTTDYAGTVDRILEGAPDYIVAAAYADEVVPLRNELEKRQTSAKLFLTDGAQTSYLLTELGERADGLEGVAPSYNLDSGFAEAFSARYGTSPLSFHASIWDSFLLSVYALARHEYKGGNEWIEDSLKKVLSGRGSSVAWNDTEKGLQLLAAGDTPDIQGAAGSLDFDLRDGVEPVQAYYALWRVYDGSFATLDIIDTDEINLVRDTQESQTTSERLKYISLLDFDTGFSSTGEQNALKAVIVSTTSQWQNYRHQSDALSVYNVLIDNGMSDDDIILMDVDDVPTDGENPLPGVIRHIVGGPDVRTGAKVDYSGDEVTGANLKNVLLGKKTAETPVVLDGNSSTNVLLFIVGHGNTEAIPFDHGDHLYADVFRNIIDEMYQTGQFRKMLVITELCFGASMADGLDTPNVLYLTSAADMEQSFAANYDPEIQVWLADDFSYKLVTAVKRNPHIYLNDLYGWLYDRVSGSHVQLLNYENFEGFRTARVSDFFIP